MVDLKKIPDNHIVFFQSQDWIVHLEVMYSDENIWLSQKLMAELFWCSADNISLHLKNIYKEWELNEILTAEDFSVVQNEWWREVKRMIKMYSLEAIIAVWYRVNSSRWIEFRSWATWILKSYIQKWFALDSDRMKYGSRFSTRYFDELYEEIRDIRTSERMMYQKITDIYATSFDYDSNAPETKEFFETVQNKLHFAITWKTTAEIIVERADSSKDKMWLTSWRKSPNWKIMPSDVVVAKNYFNKEELSNLNRIWNMYLDYAELQAAKWKIMMMKDWKEKMDAFLKFSEYEILNDSWKVSNEVAKALALKEYEKYKIKQDREYISDFDKLIEITKKGINK